MTESFSYLDLVDELSCRETPWLLEHRDELVREQRRLRVRELAVVAVLDGRGAVGDATAASDGVSVRSIRQTVDAAHKLRDLPGVAAAAYAGEVSEEQLTPLTQLADPHSDAEWAARAPNTPPAELARLARTKAKPTSAEYATVHAARSFRTWWDTDKTVLNVRGQFAAVDGAIIEEIVNRMIDRMRPAKGQAWAARDTRGADALVELCRNYADVDAAMHGAAKPLYSVSVPISGPAEVVGCPLPDSMVEALRASANIEPVLVDDLGAPVATGRASATLSNKIGRAVRLRDGHCRFPGCDRRTGLQVHHLWPRSWGGTDDIANLATVCTGGGTDHHARLAPHGHLLLLGNPNQPDGLHLIRRDQLADLAEHANAPPDTAGVRYTNTRAGPDAA